MGRHFKDDYQRLQKLAFRRVEKTLKVVRKFQKMEARIDRHVLGSEIWKLYGWLLTPSSLWPVDCTALAEDVLSSVSQGRLKEYQAIALKTLEVPPEPSRIEKIAEFEHTVQAGNYEVVAKQWQKYEEISQRLIADPEREDSWNQIKSNFPVEKYRNSRGVIRRTLIMERNFRQGWDEKPTVGRARFQVAFDAMCHRWQLYGMEYDQPLPLKLTINPTPHGLLVMIPRLWSLDFRRDINWAMVHELHHAYGAHRQGPKLSKARQEIDEEAKKVFGLSAEAKKLGLRGDKRYTFILTRLGKPLSTDESWVKRRFRQGKALVKQESH